MNRQLFSLMVASVVVFLFGWNTQQSDTQQSDTQQSKDRSATRQDEHPARLQKKQEPQRAPAFATASFMREKLVGSQQVLEGLVSEDFRLIRRGAESMKRMSEAVQWPRADDRVYEHFGTEFRSQCDKLMELAAAGNLQGTHYTFLQMTTTCVSCHSYVRKEFRIEHPDDPQGPIRLIPTEWDGKSLHKDRSADTETKRR